MYLIHNHMPDTPDGEGADAAADAAAVAAQDTTPSGDDLQLRALQAFDEGANEPEDGAPVPVAKDGDDADLETPADQGADGGDGGDPGAAPADETPEQKSEREAAERAAAAKAEDDTAVKELSLKGKAEERFREMSGKIRELSQQVEAIGGAEVLEFVGKLGGKDGLDRVVRDAADQRQWDEELTKIGATAEQFGQAVGYIAAFNSKDPAVWKQARENLQRELGVLDERLGEKTDRFDPLAAHADLKEKVRKGAMDEEDALEVARLRAAATQGQQATQQATQQQRAVQAQQEALTSLQELGAALAAKDGPVAFKAKMASIQGALNAALPELPPAQWRRHAELLYAGVAYTPPQQQPRVGKQPVRQSHGTSGAAGAVHPDTPKTPYDAFDQGIAEAREMGL